MGAVVVLVVNSFEMVILGVVMGVGWSDVPGQCEQQQKGAGTRKYTHSTLSLFPAYLLQFRPNGDRHIYV